MLWGIELKLCIWFCSGDSQLKFMFCLIFSNFEWIKPLFGLKILFFLLFSYVLQCIKLKVGILLCCHKTHIEFAFLFIPSNYTRSYGPFFENWNISALNRNWRIEIKIWYIQLVYGKVLFKGYWANVKAEGICIDPTVPLLFSYFILVRRITLRL